MTEYAALEKEMEKIDQCLNNLEGKSDDLKDKAMELLAMMASSEGADAAAATGSLSSGGSASS